VRRVFGRFELEVIASLGLTEVLNLQKGQIFLVNGAAGAVGNVCVQLAKHVFGCSKVIAICGSDEKCEWLKTIGADVTINYKTAGWEKKLDEAADGQVDAFFDNVGAQQLNAALPNMKRNGRIAVCGGIATYNGGETTQLSNWMEVVFQ
jgi:NADPH-dependent curcumin reductase CurA